MPNLQNEKVVLRTVEKEDLTLVLRWFNDAEVIQYLQVYLPMTRTAEEKWLERVNLSETDLVFLIEARTDNGELLPIGNCGLHNINWKDGTVTIGIAIGEKDHWSCGLGTMAIKLLIEYAFCQLNLRRISSAAYDFNPRSLKMHEKLGFVIEGRKRQAIFKNDRYADVIEFGLLKAEWRK